MSRIIQIKLNPNYSELQDYEKQANLLELQVQLPDGKLITAGGSYTAIVTLSVDGMLGFGMELVKQAEEMKSSEGGLSAEAMPIGYEGAQELGIILTHDSSRLVVGNADLGSYLEQVKLSQKKFKGKEIAELWKTKSHKQKFPLNQTYITDDVFEMDLLSSPLKEQIYETNDTNLMYLSIKLPDGKIVSGVNSFVVMYLSTDGMLGLGIELIRKAMRIKSSKTTEEQESEDLKPIGPSGGSSGSLGVYLTHDSCSLALRVKDLGTYDEQVKLSERTQ